MKSLARVAVFLVLALCYVGATAQDANANVKAALDAAQQWLTTVDSGNYGQSWQEASSRFQQKVSKQQWEQALTDVQKPLGKVEQREFKNAVYETSLPGAPAGKYVVIQYKTKFSRGGMIIETITPMQEKNGEWRVSGYYVKPAE